jgi:hypothetical protein
MICRKQDLPDPPLPLLITGITRVAGYNAFHFFRKPFGRLTNEPCPQITRRHQGQNWTSRVTYGPSRLWAVAPDVSPTRSDEWQAMRITVSTAELARIWMPVGTRVPANPAAVPERAFPNP